jgi:hypothetical protein
MFENFAGPIATVIAAFAAVSVTAYFAWHQKEIARAQAHIAREKLRYDLFDRRIAIYSSIFDFCEAMISWNGTPEQIAARTKFFRAYQESKFLFKKDSGIENLLKELNDKGAKVIGFKEIAHSIQNQDPALFTKTFKEISDIQVIEFPDALVKLQSAISEYLNFHEL